MSAASKQRIEVLLEKARHASQSAGVYRMLDPHAKILYIGKAKNLQNRVRTYFQGDSEDFKTRKLVAKIHDFDVILTNSEAEALILESILIKKHQPRYNILLKDDKSYPFLLVDQNHSFPKLVFTRRPRKKPGIKIFGPFASAQALRAAVRIVNRSFRLRDCSDLEFLNRSRPCLNYQIGQCSAPCTSLITQTAYQEDLQNALRVLSGHGDNVMHTLQEEMDRYSAQQEYERAAHVRDQMNFLETTMQKKPRTPVSSASGARRDVIGWFRKPDAVAIAVLFVRGGDLVDSTTFHFEGIEGRSDEEVLGQFLAQFYLTEEKLDDLSELPSGAFAFPGAEAKTLPEEVLLPFDFPESTLLVEGLAQLGHTVTLVQPQKGIRHEQLMLADKNAENAFEERQREKGSIYRVLSDLKIKLRLENYPRRMECFDISNLGDTGIVASRVTFIEGKPEKSLYRHYKIRSVTTQNDFASMREVIERRLVKVVSEGDEFEEPPDLLIIDGGKGQLAQAVEVMHELNITGIDLVALAKAKTVTEEESSREVEKAFERVFKPGRMNPIVLAPDSPVCHLLQRIRDEAHRFAVEFQRKTRSVF